ncbi:MAG: hypothetical protein BGO51_10900 [Rhodospirillales bacterium 69-11]|nr:MAG: hypothetical protein BGO51_10900 [Rhodospirillales bacterium 69-11]
MSDLREIRAFAGMTDADLGRLERGATRLELRDGATVFEQGDPSDSVYAILAGPGSIRAGVLDRRSKGLMIELLGAGEIFGEIGVIDGAPRTATAVAVGNARVARLRAASFRDALAHSPALGDALCGMLARRLRRTFALLQDATFETLEVRLARQVLYLAEREGRRTAAGVRLGRRLRQPDLADLLGGTTRSIITILNAWRAGGLVSYDGERAILTVHDLTRLRRVVEPDAGGSAH